MLNRGFSRWRAVTQDISANEQAEKLRSRSVLVKMNTSLQRGMVKSFFRWRLTALVSKLTRTREGLLKLEAEHHEQAESKTALAKANEDMAKHLLDVESRLVESKQQADVAREEMSKVQARLSAMEETAQAERKWRATKSLLHMTAFRSNHTAGRVFQAWMEYTQRKKEQNKALRRVLVLRRQKALTKSLTTWRFHAEFGVRIKLQQSLNTQQQENEVRIAGWYMCECNLSSHYRRCVDVVEEDRDLRIVSQPRVSAPANRSVCGH